MVEKKSLNVITKYGDRILYIKLILSWIRIVGFKLNLREFDGPILFKISNYDMSQFFRLISRCHQIFKLKIFMSSKLNTLFSPSKTNWISFYRFLLFEIVITQISMCLMCILIEFLVVFIFFFQINHEISTWPLIKHGLLNL